MEIRKSGPFRVGESRAWQLDLLGGGGQAGVRSYVTFVPHRGAVWRITGAGLAGPNLESTLLTTRSFRPMNDEDRAILRSTRLRIVTAEPGEDLAAVTKRTDSTWSVLEASVFNGGRSATQAFEGGERVKIAQSESYPVGAKSE
jgi:predicted Zn-dependent protease